MKYLLDTCVITDFVKNHESTAKKINKLAPDRLCISVIMVYSEYLLFIF